MYKWLSVFLIVLSSNAIAQLPVKDTTTNLQAVTNAIAIYHAATDAQSYLYSGPEHISYDPKMQGSAYFISNDWVKGSVYYDSVLFQDIPMLYDLVTDRLVILHTNGVSEFELIPERIDWFNVSGHTFVPLKEDHSNATITPGFYDKLVQGNVTIFAKREKKVEEFIEGMELRRRINAKTYYYALMDNTFHMISNQRSLLGLFKDRKKEIQQYLRKNKIKYRKNTETAIVKAAEYYNQLTH